MLQSMGLQRVGRDWVTELNWSCNVNLFTVSKINNSPLCSSNLLSLLISHWWVLGLFPPFGCSEFSFPFHWSTYLSSVSSTLFWWTKLCSQFWNCKVSHPTCFIFFLFFVLSFSRLFWLFESPMNFRTCLSFFYKKMLWVLIGRYFGFFIRKCPGEWGSTLPLHIFFFHHSHWY